MEDDLWTEPNEPEYNAQNKSDFDTIGTGIGEFYYAMRKKHVPRKYAFQLSVLMLKTITGGYR